MTKESKTKAKAQPIIAEGKLLKTDADIAKAILAAEKKGSSLQKDYQLIACSALVHLAKHKDIRIIRRMVEQFPEGLRKNSMLAFLEKYGPVRVLQEDTKGKGEKGDIVYDATRKLQLGLALENAWWKAAKEPEYKPFDFVQVVNNVINMAEKKLKDGDPAKGDKVTQAQVDALKKIVGKAA